MSESPVRRWVLVVVLVGAVVSFVAFLLLLVFGEGLAGPPSSGSDSFSVSALGHRAFARLLAESGIPVTSSRFDSARRAGPTSLLIVAEPDLSNDDDASAGRLLDGMLRRPGPTLVVLPRRHGWSDSRREGHIRAAAEHPASVPDAVLARMDPALHVVRRSRDGATIDARDWGPAPDLPDPVQLIEPSRRLEPLVTLGRDVLLGHVIPSSDHDLGDLYVLADPDLIATHGLVRGADALLVVSIVDRLRPEGGSVVIDETLHGYDVRPSLWRELFRPPLRSATISAVIAGLVLAAAGFGRFGPAKPLPPPIEPGKRFLVDHSADLLRQGAHSGHALERYLAATIQEAGRALHAPSSLDAKGLRAWVGRIERVDGSATSLWDLEARVAEAADSGNVRQVISAATAVHAWKERMTNGSRDDT